MTITTSVTLLQRVRHVDDQDAWGRFVNLYAPLIFNWGCRSGLNESDAADLSQEVLIRLLKELPNFEYSSKRGSFRGWLRTVTVNMCRDRQRLKSLTAPQIESLSQFEDTNTAREFWEVEYQQIVVKRALQLMQTDFETHVWQAAWKQIVDDQKPADIARELNLSLASVYQARSRVLRQLREQLQYLVDED